MTNGTSVRYARAMKKSAKTPAAKTSPAKRPVAKQPAAKQTPAKKPATKKAAKRPAGGEPPVPALSALELTRFEKLQEAMARPPGETAVVMLGTGMPRPDPMCFGPATAVVHDGRVFLFDAGAGVMRRMAAARLSIRGPEAVFSTHLHRDHTRG